MGLIAAPIGILFVVVFMINLHYGLIAMGESFKPQGLAPPPKEV